MFLRSLIVLCVFLALALLYQNRLPYPVPVSSFDPALAVSAMAYRFPDGYEPDFDLEMENDSTGEFEISKVLPDSIEVPSSRVSSILEVLLDGMNYETPSYFYYKTGEIPDGYDMAMCHTPRFILEFKTEHGASSNGFYICFQCRNASFFNGSLHPKSDLLQMSEEGVVAFKKLQDSLFPG